jgi:hypothetical protein
MAVVAVGVGVTVTTQQEARYVVDPFLPWRSIKADGLALDGL